jgi:hypothetical protein
MCRRRRVHPRKGCRLELVESLEGVGAVIVDADNKF